MEFCKELFHSLIEHQFNKLSSQLLLTSHALKTGCFDFADLAEMFDPDIFCAKISENGPKYPAFRIHEIQRCRSAVLSGRLISAFVFHYLHSLVSYSKFQVSDSLFLYLCRPWYETQRVRDKFSCDKTPKYKGVSSGSASGLAILLALKHNFGCFLR